jgi:pimeloyl-ACP methyl ester carboxylesterase
MDNIDLKKFEVPKNEYEPIKVGGHTILFSQSKKKHKKHILFIHGIGASSLGWRDIPDALSEQFHTIAVDLIGFGGSEKPQEVDYTVKGLSKFIVDFLDALNIKNEKISLVGHSLGGYVSLRIAIENKNLVEKIVLIDSSGLLKQPTLLLRQYLDAAMESDPILRYKKVQRVFEDLYADRSRLLPIVVDTFIGTIGQPGAKRAFEISFSNSTTTSIEPQEFELIKHIPCLILWGENDNLIPLHDYAFRFLDNLPNAELKIIKDSGHAPFAEKTAQVYKIIHTFMT